ncbi:methyltransferase domain-containing protein [endosymbiont of Riftia pachyptila]|uniref:16S rRNA (cytosine(967)-C(5))-methyltransferase n=2 Tax=sulfur-oxidizing symbionts TaxID=32036 RepID=G2DF78_9GAMM|nr:ribosomal RNA small subunit methyltransferase B [endosymbiont of Riftia pachyptila (vent Ph05)]
MSLRINCRQVDRADYLERLREQQITAEPVPHTESGLTLQRPVDVLELPGFSDGAVSVQDGGAQLAAPLLELQPGQRVLDACAAPGGKTGHMLELADDLRLTAIDLDPQRLQRVAENLQRLGLQAELQAGDAAHPQGRWAERQYDRILLDVPCSATGVMRRHPDIKYLRSEADIDRLGRLQGQILDAIWPLLKPGGLLLYATCSLLPQENEQQLEAFLQRCG